MRVRTEYPRAVRELPNVWIPLEDGSRLAARIWLPDDADADPVPAILEYIPYRKNDWTWSRDATMHPYVAGHGYACIRVDLRGSGDSAEPTDLAAYTVERMVGDVVGLLDALAIERAHLVGHDWGAAIAWFTATFAPDRVRSLTALSVGHPAAFRAVGLPQREKSWYMLLFQFPGIAEEWLRADDLRNFR